MSASEEKSELSDVNSVNFKLSSSSSYEIEEESDNPFIDLSTSDGDEDVAAFAKELLANAEWIAEYERKRKASVVLDETMYKWLKISEVMLISLRWWEILELTSPIPTMSQR